MFIFKRNFLPTALILCLPLLAAVGCKGGSSGSGSAGSSSSSSSSGSAGVELTFNNLYALTNIPIGVAVSAGNEAHSILSYPAQQDTIRRHFSQITAGNIMKMSYLHPQENTYTFDDADALYNWAAANGVSLHGHTLIWHSDYQVPDWMKNYSGDWAAILNAHVQTIVAHFAGKVDSWDVVNEAFESSGYRNSIFYQNAGAAYLENAFVTARAADPDALLYYNDYSLASDPVKLGHVLDMVDDFQTRGIPIDGIGFQMHVQLDSPDIAAITNAFQQVVDRGIKVKISELDVPLNNPYTGGFPQYTRFTAAAAERQKQRYHDIVEAYLNTVPAAQRGGITVWGLWDSDSWLLSFPGRQGVDDWPLLFTGPGPEGPFSPKSALQGFGDALMGM